MVILLSGFALVVLLVLTAAYTGYRASDNIQDTAQAIVHEQLGSQRGAQLERRLVDDTQVLLDRLQWILGLCFLLAVATAATTVWLVRRVLSRLAWQARELSHVSWHLLDSQEKTARRLSHEMHDELGQSLAALKKMLGRATPGDFEPVRRQGLEVVNELIESMRRLSQTLRPVVLDDLGLPAGLRWLCDGFAQRTGIEVEYASEVEYRLAENLETHLFRIAQEALTNVARHSGATTVKISLSGHGDKIEMSILDNGKGIAPESEPGRVTLGMLGMRARARQINGDLVIRNTSSGGALVSVTAPAVRDGANVLENSRVTRG